MAKNKYIDYRWNIAGVVLVIFSICSFYSFGNPALARAIVLFLSMALLSIGLSLVFSEEKVSK